MASMINDNSQPIENDHRVGHSLISRPSSNMHFMQNSVFTYIYIYCLFNDSQLR